MPIQETMPASFRSENVQEIISRQPGFAETWALAIFTGILLLLLAFAWIVQYPDIVIANATLTAENAPKEIISRQEGKIVRLFITNDAAVLQGQMLVWLESTASHQQVINLSGRLDSSISLLIKNQTESVVDIFKLPFSNLGELQPAYQNFTVALQQFNDYLNDGYYLRKKKSLYSDELYLQKMHQSIEKQKDLSAKDVQLSQEAMEANNSLLKEKVISQQDMRDMKSKLFGKQMSLPQLESAILSNEISQAEKEKEIKELEHTISQQKFVFQQAAQTLKSLVDDWKRKYVMTAPVGGKVSFIIPLQENQFLSAGKVVGFVNPPDSRYYAIVNLNQNNFGKVKAGQRVQLRFDAYPYQEVGYVEGRLDYVSKVPSDSGFLANISLPRRLTTQYNQEIQYRNGLKSQAVIITRNMRLLQRFYYNIFRGVAR